MSLRRGSKRLDRRQVKKEQQFFAVALFFTPLAMKQVSLIAIIRQNST
jgi:hypothetical protein